MKITMALVLIATVATSSQAWYIPGNPDAFPSIGFNVHNEDMRGDRYEISRPSDPILNLGSHGPQTSTKYSIGFDVRLPVTRNLTLGTFYNDIETSQDFTRVSDGQPIYKETINMDGYSYGFNARFYLK